MTALLLITTQLNAVVLSLTPLERLKAVGSRLGANLETDSWFILTTLAAIIVLMVMLSVVGSGRTVRRRRTVNSLFAEYARKSGLSQHESLILLQIARKAALKREEAIFTMGDAFDRGAAIMIQESLSQQGAEESQRLKTELSSLCEKLGFQRVSPTAMGLPTKARKLSSRQIPVGKKLHITRRKTRNLADIESTVVKNDDIEITVKLATQVETAPGEFWRARYYFGASVWEFDTSVVGCTGDVLVLNHSDDVRFVNRRRFLRVPVNKPAFVARFPFAKTLPLNSDMIKEHLGVRPAPPNVAGSNWGPPEFVPAVVTELAGPGLRIQLPLNVKIGERVLVVFKLNGESSKGTGPQETGEGATMKIVEDIGEVRHIKAVENGFSIAVELTGLGDSDVNELIRATNAASLTTKTESQDVPDPSGGYKAKESVPELAAAQRV